MVTMILRPVIYYPVRRISTPILGPRCARNLVVMSIFTVSGLMHEVMYYYLTRVPPTWEVTWFFVLHGMSMAIEVEVKKAVNDRWRLHRLVLGPLTLVFLAVTATLSSPTCPCTLLVEKLVDTRMICTYHFDEKI
ncbi:unnamed protein product [Malus baccata var. baccata]